MDDIDAAFDDAFRTFRIEAGDDPNSLPNPYARPALGGPASSTAAGSNSTDTGGGFIADESDVGGGGFIVDDDNAGGGFIPDDDDTGAGGGFLPEDEDEASPSQPSGIAKPTTIPLSAIPEALANLGLDSSDPSVLSLFAETAYAPSSSRRRLAPGVKVEKVVGRQEFQQVAAVLVEELKASSKGQKRQARAEDGEAGSSSRRPTRRAAVQGRQKAADIIGEEDGGGGFVVDGDDSEDDFEAFSSRRRRRTGAALDTGSDLSSEEDVDLDSSSRHRRRPGRAAQASPSASASPSPSAEEDTPKRQRRSRKSPTAPSIRSTTHLNPLQRSNASTLFTLLLDRLPPSTFPAAQRRIGTTELTTILASLGETLPAKEIEEMVEEAAKLFAPASEDGTGERKSAQAVKGAAAAQGIGGASVGLDEFAGVLVHNRLL